MRRSILTLSLLLLFLALLGGCQLQQGGPAVEAPLAPMATAQTPAANCVTTTSDIVVDSANPMGLPSFNDLATGDTVKLSGYDQPLEITYTSPNRLVVNNNAAPEFGVGSGHVSHVLTSQFLMGRTDADVMTVASDVTAFIFPHAPTGEFRIAVTLSITRCRPAGK